MPTNGVNGRFQAKALTFKVSAGEFVVDCGKTGMLAAGTDCTQQTVKLLALALTKKQLNNLKDDLRKALDELEAIGSEEV